MRAMVRYLCWSCWLLVLCAQALGESAPISLKSVADPGQIRHRRDMRFDVEYLERDRGWVSELLARADAARRIMNEATPDALLSTVHITLAPDRKTFMRLVGDWAENSAAVAVGDSSQVIINGDALRAGSVGTLGTTLVHELTHLYLDTRCERPLPRWLNEGIAMSVAGEWSMEDAASLMMAATLGRLIPLHELENQFPIQADRQRLAYLESHALVSFLARQTPENSVAGVIQPIVGAQGKRQIEMYWTPSYRDDLESKWHKSLRKHWNWTVIALSSGLFWGVVAILTFVAWLIRRHRSKLLHQEWDEEEHIYKALDEEEERIWGKEDEEEEPEDEEPWRQR